MACDRPALRTFVGRLRPGGFGIALDVGIPANSAEGVANKIGGVVIDGEPFPGLNNTKWPGLLADRLVGKVTSAIYSPRIDANIGYAWLPVNVSQPGQSVRIETEWGAPDAKVTPMPFVDPQKRIPVS